MQLDRFIRGRIHRSFRRVFLREGIVSFILMLILGSSIIFILLVKSIVRYRQRYGQRQADLEALIFDLDVFIVLGAICFSKLVEHSSQWSFVKRLFGIDKVKDPHCGVKDTVRETWWLLVNLVFVILWYAYRYNSEGTENPDWTSVFG